LTSKCQFLVYVPGQKKRDLESGSRLPRAERSTQAPNISCTQGTSKQQHRQGHNEHSRVVGKPLPSHSSGVPPKEAARDLHSAASFTALGSAGRAALTPLKWAPGGLSDLMPLIGWLRHYRCTGEANTE
jgi:hypothetical protein